jgi:outer membrane protein assembly factor BamB
MQKLSLAGIILLSSVLGWSADYLADGPDAGRTGWVKNEKIFNTTNVKGMKLLWKLKLDSTPREMHNLFPPVVVDKVTTSSGVKEIAVVAGITDDLFGIDTATGKQIWHKHFDSTFVQPAGGRGGGTLCPGGQTATPVVGPGSGPGKFTTYAVSWDGRLRQINVADGEDLAVPANFMPANGKPWSLNLYNGVIYTGTSQGCGGVPFSFFSYDLATKKSSAYLPAGGGLWGRRGPAISSDGVVWMGTGDGYYNPELKNLGNSIVGVKPDANKELQLMGWFAPPNVNWLWHRDLDINVSPMAIDYKGKHLLIGTSKECRVWLVDQADAMGTTGPYEKNQKMLDRSPLICNPGARYDAAGVWGAMATWIDPAGQLFIAVPFLGPLAETYHSPIEVGKPVMGGVAVLKVEVNAGKWHLAPAWTYGDIYAGDEAIYANGILFVNGAGEDTYQAQQEKSFDETPRIQSGGRGSADRIANSGHSTIYALDAVTGKQLWSSGNQIVSFNHGSGMTAVNGKVYTGTYDGYIYCFGVAK